MFPKLSRILCVGLACIVFLTGCEKPAQKEAKYIQRGNALYDQGEYDKARLEYKNAEQIMPTDAEPRYRLGLVDESQNDPRNAFANFISAEQQNPHYHPALLKIAQYFIAAEQYNEADHRLNIVLGDMPDDPEGHALRASILLRRKEYDGAEKEARIALAKDPDNITATSVLTGLYSNEHNQAKAVAALNEGIAKNPDNVSLRLLKVMLYEQTSEIDKAAQAYQDVFKLKPNVEIFRADLAKIYEKSGKLDQAEATLRAGVAAMPDDWQMKRDLIVFLSEHRDMAVTEKEIRTLMQKYPSNDDLYFWLADLYISHHATDRAVALLEQIISSSPSDGFALGARTDLARIQFLKGNRELAQKLVSAVLEKAPGNQDALYIRAQMSFDEGNYKDAVADLRAIIRDNPHAVNAIGLLSEALAQQGYTDLAIDTMNQLVDIDPANMAAQVRLAQMYNLNGNPDHALEILSSVTKLQPTYAVAWEAIARITIGTKDWPTAQAAIVKLNTLAGQHWVAMYLEGQVQDKNGKLQDATGYYKQAFTADPTSPLAEHALSSYVEAQQRLHQLPDAINTLQALQKDTPFINTLLGGCYKMLGNDKEAAAYLDKALAEKPASPDTYIGRAELYLKAGNQQQALDLLKTAQQEFPADMRAYAMSASLLEQTGNYQEAIALYNTVLDRHPNVDAIANNLAEIMGDYQCTDPSAMEKARQIAERFAQSDNPIFLDTLGWVYYCQGNFQQAQTVMERIRSLKGTLPPEVHYHLGSLLLKLGNTASAKEELQLATVASAHYPGMEDARRKLQNL
jgi:tetratricopeptide (TPR) repeat protein